MYIFAGFAVTGVTMRRRSSVFYRPETRNFAQGSGIGKHFFVEFRQHVLSTMGVKYVWQPPFSPQFRERRHAILHEGALGSAMDPMVALSQQTTSHSRTARSSI
jgi:hypothetical protein